MATGSDKVKFVSRKNKNFRRTKVSSDSEEDFDGKGNMCSTVGDMKELQKLRKRPSGVNVNVLNEGKKHAKVTSKQDNDPYKTATGGFVNMKRLHERRSTGDDEIIGTSFAAETNRRDEDADMLKYVEEELAKRKGVSEEDKEKQRRLSASQEDKILSQVREDLRKGTNTKTEDMLSNQMLSGIPEVDLGIEAKMKNIEATEDAKQKLIMERRKKKEKISDFVPTNMAVNFVQHNRFNIEDTAPVLKPQPKKEVEVVPVRVGDDDIKGNIGKSKKDKEKATDDFHFEKFKKQMRR